MVFMLPAAEQDMLERLATVYRMLIQAMAQQDWTSMGQADAQLRECLQVLAGWQELSPQLIQMKQRLQEIHGLAMNGCRDECARLNTILQAYLASAEVRSAYSQTALYQDE